MADSDKGNAYDNMLNPSGFGVFSDEGMISGPFYNRDSAERAMRQDDPDGESGLYVTGVCPDHEEQPWDACEQCMDEDEDEEEISDEDSKEDDDNEEI